MPASRPPRSSAPGPTSKDVARRAGASQATVSLVLSGKAQGRVSPAVQEAVRRAAHDLGYRPSPAARALRTGRMNLIAFAVPQASNPFFGPVFEAAEREARGLGLAAVLIHIDNDARRQDALVRVLTEHAVDGFVLWRDPGEMDAAALGSRVVLVEATRAGVPSVLVDVETGVREAMRHLLTLGHRHIAHLASDIPDATFLARAAAYRAALAGAQVPALPQWQENTPLALGSARRAAATLLAATPRPTAILCDHELLAAGVYKAAREAGLVVPRDVSVVAFDGTDLAEILDPELTTITVPAARLGQVAVRLLHEWLESGANREPHTVTVRPSFTPRASTAEPGR